MMKRITIAAVMPATGRFTRVMMAGLGLAVVNALEDSACGTFMIGASIPLAIVVWSVHASLASRQDCGSDEWDDRHHPRGAARYAWVTLAPLAFVAVTTIAARVPEREGQLLTDGRGPDPALHVQGYVSSVPTVVMMVCVVVILASAVIRWAAAVNDRVKVTSPA